MPEEKETSPRKGEKSILYIMALGEERMQQARLVAMRCTVDRILLIVSSNNYPVDDRGLCQCTRVVTNEVRTPNDLDWFSGMRE